MKSIVLLLWLTVPNGADQFLLTKHVDNTAVCEHMGQALVHEHALGGKQVRFQCHEVVEEVGNVDENGNPIDPPIMHANNHKTNP
ncbi:MAG: hypothetical protein H6935_06380 [Thiobacillus sp.]|nr:hypothetical protein [Thiobacillus sp.]